jgi:hypothetical protein
MTSLEIEEIKREGDLLIRSCRININGNTIVTPAKTITTTLKSSSEIPIIQSNPDFSSNTLGEVFITITEDNLRQIRQDRNEGERFSSQLTARVAKLKQIGALPYILFSIVDSSGQPLNRLLSDELFEFMYSVLWGVQGNAIVAMPLLGVLRESKEYSKLIEGFHQRQMDSVDRKNQPLMAIIPSSYSLIDKALIEKYWKAGCRLFAFDCANKKFGAYSPIIERIHYTLSQHSKHDEEPYVLNALNSKFKLGRQEASRINNLIATGYGFDIYSPNHVPPRGAWGSDVKHFIFNNTNYGFVDLNDLQYMKDRSREEIINTRAFKGIDDLSSIQDISLYQKQKLCKQHDMEKTLSEIRQYQKRIDSDKLMDYFTQKERIRSENQEIKSFNVTNVRTRTAKSKWLKK